MAVEHGINFFVYCWYRAGKADAVETHYAGAIEALKKSKFVDQFKFSIMWENQARDLNSWGQSGVSDEADLLERLLPFWMTNYFQHPSYLKIDNKPLLYIYDATSCRRIWAARPTWPGLSTRCASSAAAPVSTASISSANCATPTGTNSPTGSKWASTTSSNTAGR